MNIFMSVRVMNKTASVFVSLVTGHITLGTHSHVGITDMYMVPSLVIITITYCALKWEKITLV